MVSGTVLLSVLVLTYIRIGTIGRSTNGFIAEMKSDWIEMDNNFEKAKIPRLKLCTSSIVLQLH